MPSIIKERDKYRAYLWTRGIRESKLFLTKREATAWAHARDAEIRELQSKPENSKTLADAMQRYSDEVSPTKRGKRWEQIRLDALMRDEDFPAQKKLAKLEPEDFGRWRDVRVKQVAPGTVLRELGLISAVLKQARREWRWISSNPVEDIRKPTRPDHRDILITRPQIKAMLKALGYKRQQVRSVSEAVAVAFLLALRTGMRAGELCKLRWCDVHDQHVYLPVTKTKSRDVPLSNKAKRLLDYLRQFDQHSVLGLSPQTLDALFRKYRKRARLSGFVFHDTRHTAATWMAQRLHVLDLCRVFGWSNTSRALTYYNPKAADIAKRI